MQTTKWCTTVDIGYIPKCHIGWTTVKEVPLFKMVKMIQGWITCQGEGLSSPSSFTPIGTNIQGLKVGYLMGEKVTKLEESVASGFWAVHFLLEKGFWGFWWVLHLSR